MLPNAIMVSYAQTLMDTNENSHAMQIMLAVTSMYMLMIALVLMTAVTSLYRSSVVCKLGNGRESLTLNVFRPTDSMKYSDELLNT